MTFGRFLTGLRERKRNGDGDPYWSCRRLATAIGMKRQNLWRIEKGLDPPLSPERIRKVCEVLKAPEEVPRLNALAVEAWAKRMGYER